jgi:hypothetical protein
MRKNGEEAIAPWSGSSYVNEIVISGGWPLDIECPVDPLSRKYVGLQMPGKAVRAFCLLLGIWLIAGPWVGVFGVPAGFIVALEESPWESSEEESSRELDSLHRGETRPTGRIIRRVIGSDLRRGQFFLSWSMGSCIAPTDRSVALRLSVLRC